MLLYVWKTQSWQVFLDYKGTLCIRLRIFKFYPHGGEGSKTVPVEALKLNILNAAHLLDISNTVDVSEEYTTSISRVNVGSSAYFQNVSNTSHIYVM
jgi:hypothetical protein